METLKLISTDGKVWTTTQSGTTRIPHAFTDAGVAVCRKNIKPARFGHYFTLDEVRSSTVMEAPCLNCQKKLGDMASREQQHRGAVDATHVEALEEQKARVFVDTHFPVVAAFLKGATPPPVVDEGRIRVGERVSFTIRRRTIRATTSRVDDAGRIGIVVDGDQTGQVRYISPEHLTVLVPDLNRLHAEAAEEDRLRAFVATLGTTPDVDPT